MAPTEPPCWPNDPDYLDGRTVLKVPSDPLAAYWDADILDDQGNEFDPPIISVTQNFQIRYRVELHGRLWLCIAGQWCFDYGFTPIGAGTGFNLRDRLPAGTFDVDWRGCETRCIEHVVQVPAGTITAGDCGTLYDVGARYQLHCCDHVLSVIAGFEVDEDDYEFWNPDA
jgi:hypothetical protein